MNLKKVVPKSGSSLATTCYCQAEVIK